MVFIVNLRYWSLDNTEICFGNNSIKYNKVWLLVTLFFGNSTC